MSKFCLAIQGGRVIPARARIRAYSIGGMPPASPEEAPAGTDLSDRLLISMQKIQDRHGRTYVCGLTSVTYLFNMARVYPEGMKRTFEKGGLPELSALLEKVVMRGIENGEIMPIDPEEATSFLFGRLLDLIRQSVEDPSLSLSQERIENTWSCAWKKVTSGPHFFYPNH